MVAQSTIQYSFNKGQWSKRLAARVDLAGYNSGAELLRNFFVDYRGGATTRPGGKYLLQAYDSTKPVRLIPFQASTAVGYVMELGEYYMRPYYNGAPVLETGVAITGITKANPAVVSVTNTWSVGEIVYIQNAGGMVQVNDRYFKISARSGGTITLADLNGMAINSSAYTTWTSGGTVSRVYQIASPFAAADLALVRFVQNVNQMIFCHEDYVPQLLTLTSATSWAFASISFGSTASAPSSPSVATTLAAGSVNYAYVVTSVDLYGQESAVSAIAALASKTDIRTTAGTNTISWSAVNGAVSYNVYRAQVSYAGAVPAGQLYGFIGNTTGVSLIDSNIVPDFSSTAPIAKNPFIGAGLASLTVVTPGTYLATVTVPTVTIGASSGGVTATGSAVMQAKAVSVNSAGNNYAVNDGVTVSTAFGGLACRVTGTNGSGGVTGIVITGNVSITSGALPSNGLPTTTSGVGSGCTLDITWEVASLLLTNPGSGYTSAPTVTIGVGSVTATASATVLPSSAGNPIVPAIFQQRLWLLGLSVAPQSFNASQTGAYFNFNISNPIQDDDAISGNLASGQLNTIKAAISMQAGLVVFSDRASWLINGGSAGSAVTPGSIVANPQAYNGIADIPPIVANYDILYVQAKGSVVRNASYSFYTNVYTGTDISVVASDLFYGYNLTEWAWAEEPFKVVWAVRDDGKMLSLTFEKQQEFIAWAQHDTDGDFKSVCTVTEMIDTGLTDAVYYVVERVINGNTVKYIERAADLYYPTGVIDAWQVDSGLHYSGSPATSFYGAEHLAGATVTGLADGTVITPFTMPTNGFFTLSTAAAEVTIGLAFTAQLKSLRVDLGSGQSTIQGKAKKVPGIVIRVADTLGLYAGTDFDHLVPLKDLIQGNVSSMKIGETTQTVSDLVDGDARVFLNPAWTTTGQYCLQQTQPLPASVLGLIPELTVGDTK
jgi:hypothetical protein